MRDLLTTANGYDGAPPTSRASGDAFAEAAGAALGYIDLLLGVRLIRGRRQARDRGLALTSDVRDPEFRKNLRTLARLVSHAETLERRACFDERALAELTDALRLPAGARLTTEALLVRRFRLEMLLLEHGDAEYLRERAAAVYWGESPTARVRWRSMYGDQAPPILAGACDGRLAPPGEGVERTRAMLLQLFAAKHYDDVPTRNSNELSLRALRVIAPVVLLASGAFGLAIALVAEQDNWVLVAASAGAIGAALGTLIRVRDHLVSGSQIREFTPFFIAQVAVGVTAGLLAYLVDASGIVTVDGDAHGLAAIAFALGFTEAAFLRLIARVADLAGSPKEQEDAPSD
jgi:hypothetical protein